MLLRACTLWMLSLIVGLDTCNMSMSQLSML